jgi:predicted nucleic acid-binding protein
MERAFVDTSAWFAYANRLDPDHTRIHTVLPTFQGRLVTSNFVFDETVTLCL